jgi:hypothetical protein
MSVVVFLGPSLPRADAERVLGATYLPPVAQGDILRVLPGRPAVIGIVDGYFRLVPAVWHKEILVALAQGVHVLGAASMGALRAAELECSGMVGVGEVFDWYRTGMLDADDEVAVVHGPPESGYCPMSVALVDIRDACRAAREAGVLTAALADDLLRVAKDLYYPHRSWPTVLSLALDHGAEAAEIEAFRTFLGGHGPGVKQRDALALLRHAAALVSADAPPVDVGPVPERTVFLERLQYEVDQEAAAGTANALPAGSDPRRRALLHLLARHEADRLGWTVAGDEFRQAVVAFRRRSGLLSVHDVLGWMAAEGITDDAFRRAVADDLLLGKLERLYGHRIDAALADEIRLATAERWQDASQKGRAPVTE